jgi:hypothetical protein
MIGVSNFHPDRAMEDLNVVVVPAHDDALFGLPTKVLFNSMSFTIEAMILPACAIAVLISSTC